MVCKDKKNVDNLLSLLLGNESMLNMSTQYDILFWLHIFYLFLSSVKPTASLIILQNQVKWLGDSIIKLHQI